MEQQQIVVVLAGSYPQWLDFLRRAPSGKKYVFVDSRHKLAGMHIDAIEVVGTFWQLRDADELYRVAEERLRRSCDSSKV